VSKLTREQANIEGKKLFDQWVIEKEMIFEQAKSDGTYCYVGLDSNNHLIKDLNEQYKRKLEDLNSKIDD
jgi:hypothetical protein